MHSLLVATLGFISASGLGEARHVEWLAASQASALSPLMIRGSEVELADAGALGDFLVPTITANEDQPGDASFAEFQIEVPKAGDYCLWARLRCPDAEPASFAVQVAGDDAPPKVLGGSSDGVRQWHWDSEGDGGEPGEKRLVLSLPATRATLRICARRAGACVYFPMRWRQAEPTFGPRLNLLCLTDDPAYVPTDDDAARALKLARRPVGAPRVEDLALPPVSGEQLRAAGRKRLPDWMRCPRWYTKDSWREELSSRHPGDMAALVRQVAANGGSALRLSVFWGGEAYYQSRVAPHAPGLGEIDYLREAVDEGRRTGVRIIVYMNPNALYSDHPLYPECAIRAADGRASSVPSYGGHRKNTFYACINHPRYRQFLREVLDEIFSQYGPAGLYVDGLTPHVCFCEHCRRKYREMFGVEMPVAKFSKIGPYTVWGEFGRDPQPVGDVENDPDARRLTGLLYQTLCEATDEFTATVKRSRPDAVTCYHSHPKAGCAAAYDGTLTEVYSPRPWVHTAWRCGELAGYSSVFHVPVMFNVYPHEHFTAAEARYKAFQGLANGAYPNFWSTPGMKPVFDFMARHADSLDFATATPVKFLALPRDLRVDATQRATPPARGVRYGRRDRFLAPYVGAYSALMRAGVPVVTLHRPHFEEQLAGFRVLVLANVSNLSDEQADAVRQFVRAGGGLIATHETSLCDVKGQRRRDFALGDVLGVAYERTLPAGPREIRLDPAHPCTASAASAGDLSHDEPHVAVRVKPGSQVLGRLRGDDLEGQTVPAVVVHTFGQGRAVYLPGRLDSMQCYNLSPAIERLFAGATAWACGGRPAVQVSASGPVGVTLVEQPGRLLIHLVNHDRDSRFQSDAYRPVKRVVVRLPEDAERPFVRASRLWNPASLPIRREADAAVIELKNLEEYELLQLDLLERSPAAESPVPHDG